jgi:hypothetical protein
MAHQEWMAATMDTSHEKMATEIKTVHERTEGHNTVSHIAHTCKNVLEQPTVNICFIRNCGTLPANYVTPYT